MNALHFMGTAAFAVSVSIVPTWALGAAAIVAIITIAIHHTEV